MKVASIVFCLIFSFWIGTSASFAARNGLVKLDGVEVYEAPSPSAQVLETLRQNTPIAASNSSVAGFFKVRTPAGRLGWTLGTALTLEPAPSPQEISEDMKKLRLKFTSPEQEAQAPQPAGDENSPPPPPPEEDNAETPPPGPDQDQAPPPPPPPAPSSNPDDPEASPDDLPPPPSSSSSSSSSPSSTPPSPPPSEELPPPPEPASSSAPGGKALSQASLSEEIKVLGMVSLFQMGSVVPDVKLTQGFGGGGQGSFPLSDKLSWVIRVERVAKTYAFSDTNGNSFTLSLTTLPLMTGISFRILTEPKYQISLGVLAGLGLQTGMDITLASGDKTQLSAQPLAYLIEMDFKWKLSESFSLHGGLGYRVQKSPELSPPSTVASLLTVPTVLDFGGPVLQFGAGYSF